MEDDKGNANEKRKLKCVGKIVCPPTTKCSGGGGSGPKPTESPWGPKEKYP